MSRLAKTNKSYYRLSAWVVAILLTLSFIDVSNAGAAGAKAGLSPLTGIVQISNNHALDKNGVLWGWKEGEYQARAILDEVTSFWSNGFYGGAVKEDGSVWAWGTQANIDLIFDEYEEALDNNAYYQAEPVQIEGLSESKLFTNGYAVDAKGQVWAVNPANRTAAMIAGLSDIVTVDDQYALDRSGDLWKFSEYGKLIAKPVVVASQISYLGDGLAVSGKWGVYELWTNEYLANHGGLFPYEPLIDLSSIASGIGSIAGTADDRGSDFSLIVKKDGTVWSWGFGTSRAFRQINGLSGVKAAAAKYEGGTVLYKDGTVGAWSGFPEGGFPPQDKPNGLKATPVKVTKQISVLLDGRKIALQPSPVLSGGRVLIPVRGLFEALGGTVHYANDKVTISYGKRKVELAVWSTDAVIDGQPIKLDVPAQIVNGRTMVPLRFVAEALGVTVKWDSSRSRVELTTAN